VQTGNIRPNLGEMHGDECANFTPRKGDTGTLTFMRGGPTVGFWQFRQKLARG